MKLSQEVLTVLSRCEVAGSHTLRLPPGQLDRKLYLKVDEALQALGGKWSRKLKLHEFELPVAELLDDALVTGEVTRAADFGFFETPEPLAEELVAAADIQPGMFVLEPSAGRGRIARELVRALDTADSGLVLVELLPENRKHLEAAGFKQYLSLTKDFLEYDPIEPFDRVVMNPPFAKGAAIYHMRRALEMLKFGGRLVSVAPAGVLFREDTLHKTFREMIKQMGGTITPLPEGTFKESGTMVSTCVVKVDA